MFKYTYFTIFSNSLSCFQSLHSMNIDHPYICRIPRHIGIHENNESNYAAKSALEFEIVKFKIPITDLNHFIKL